MNESTTQGPLLFYEFGKKSEELLRDGYYGESVLLTFSATASGTTIAATAGKRRERLAAGVKTLFDFNNHSFEFELDTILSPVDSDDELVSAKFILSSEVLPSTTAKAVISIPDYISSQFCMWSLHQHATVSLSTALSPYPAIGLSATAGTPSIAFGLGMEMVEIMPTRWYPLCSAGIQVTKPAWDAYMLLDHNARSLKASYVHYLDNAKKISAGVAITQGFSTHDHSFMAGGSWVINHLTKLKARLDGQGMLKTVLRRNIRDMACLTITAEFDTKNFNKKPGIGLAIALEL